MKLGHGDGLPGGKQKAPVEPAEGTGARLRALLLGAVFDLLGTQPECNADRRQGARHAAPPVCWLFSAAARLVRGHRHLKLLANF